MELEILKAKILSLGFEQTNNENVILHAVKLISSISEEIEKEQLEKDADLKEKIIEVGFYDNI